jgi:Ankyrin repeats (3 copies)
MNHQLQRALEDAAWDGDQLAVAALITHPDVDAASGHSTALLHAAHRGHWRCVQLLLPVSDPSARNAEALWRACKHCHARVVRLLGPVSDMSGWEGWMWDALPMRSQSLLQQILSRAVAAPLAAIPW